MRAETGANAGAARAAAEPAARGGEGIARRGIGCRCVGVAVVPGITDGQGELEAVATAAKEAGRAVVFLGSACS